MMMLLLIHLDAYAYEVISACQVDTQDEMAIPSAADTFQEEDVNVLEWEDLSSSNIKYIDNQLVTVIKIQMICKCKYKTI